MNLDYIIVQAGGMGSRMQRLTKNKPKALVPVNNLPMIFHLFRKYPDKKFIVIGDYKYSVLEKYLKAFAKVDYCMVCGTGKKGTCAGLREALSYIPDDHRFMLIWCDLILSDDYEIPNSENNIVGLSKDFRCRWKYENDVFTEEPSSEFGVAGHFIFQDKSWLSNVPEEGEFVRWLQGMGYKFETQDLYRTHEYGIYEEWDKLPKMRCRPFNSIKIDGDRIWKEPLDEQGRQLATREIAWYKQLQGVNFQNLPYIHHYEPLCMEYIDGKNIYEYQDISIERKEIILEQIINCLKQVHNIGSIESDYQSYLNAYIDKTFDRLEKVVDLVPFASNETVVVNGKTCRNIFFHKNEVMNEVQKYFPSKFHVIHGDCTFSNTLLKNDITPILIDPRGYFGTTEIYGDVAYDWVKLYYSLVSNYDQFNLKRFDLNISDNEVNLSIASNGWEDLEDKFFELLGEEVSKHQMKLLVAIVWLSLTTYAWEDYDSICGAFYNGLYYLEEAL